MTIFKNGWIYRLNFSENTLFAAQIESNCSAFLLSSTHITHRGTGRRFRLSSLRHINHSRGRLGASCALVSRGSRYISLQVKCNQFIYTAKRIFASAHSRARMRTYICASSDLQTTYHRSFLYRYRTDCKQPVGTIRDW